MEVEDQTQKKKFVCKFCSKKFPCGKSLGGHIRTHLNKKPTLMEKDEEDDEIDKAKLVKFSTSGFEAGGQSGYALRENPKKTWRFAGSGPNFQLQQLKICKECGKGFQSLKALCGHMACHSDKDKSLMSKLEEDEISVMDSQSDTETSAPSQRRISKRLKYQSLDLYDSMAKNGSSSGGSGIEQEQEEVAISLMMLSRDSGHKGVFLSSFGDSSDNNSEVMEAKSSSFERIGTKNGVNCASNVNDIMSLMRTREKKMKLEEIEIDVSDNSDSGYFRHEPKKVESDVSSEFRKVKPQFGSRYEGHEPCDVKSREGFHIKSESFKELSNEEADQDQVQRGGSSKYALRKTTKNGFHRPFANVSSNAEICRNNARKNSKYVCLTCNKTFHSHRALGGHRASHTKTNAGSESMYESGENSMDTDDVDVSPVPASERKIVEHFSGKRPMNDESISGSAKRNSGGSKKSKGHECPFCFKVFRSGQALGGHKRSHFVGGCEVKTVVLAQEPDQAPHEAEITALFDLNLPAPMEEEANEQFGFMAW